MRIVAPGDEAALSDLSAEVLKHLYVNQGMTLEEIGRRFRLSRQAVLYRMRRLGITRRTLSQARRHSLETKAIELETLDTAGLATRRVLVSHHANSSLFETWSTAMAYALGVIATDGNIQGNQRLAVGQKEPELLQKLLTILDSDAELKFRPRRVSTSGVVSGELWEFRIFDRQLVEGLLALGITPRKSKTLQFPPVPAPLMRHFVRGCWDGDGSVYRDEKQRIHASYVTASPDFAEGLLSALASAEVARPTLYIANGALSFKLHGTACTRLFEYLYWGVGPALYLERKHEVFLTWIEDRRPELPGIGKRWLDEEMRWIQSASEREKRVEPLKGWRRDEDATRRTWSLLDSASRDGQLTAPSVFDQFKAALIGDGRHRTIVDTYLKVAREYVAALPSFDSDSVLPEEFLESNAGARKAARALSRSALLAFQKFIVSRE